jgi:predicted RNA binding protein YcfA (HicA-like mRNA interferase family)
MIQRANYPSPVMCDDTIMAAFVMKVRDLVRLLEAAGWRHAKTEGSHHNYVRPGSPGHIIIPGRPGDDIAIGTAQIVLKKAGIR